MRRSAAGLALLAGLFLADAHACETELGPPQQGRDGRWQYEASATASSLALLDVRVRETSQDLDVEVSVGTQRAISDIPPSRYATERVSVPFWKTVRATVHVRANEASSTSAAPVEVRCINAWDRGFMPALAQTSAADAAFRAMHEPATGEKTRRLNEALRRTEWWHALASDPDDEASARMLEGYLASRVARFADAAAAFGDAENLLLARGADAPAFAARFYRAQAVLAAGRAEDADALLVSLASPEVARRYPLIAGWAQNDRCIALRAAGRGAESVDCFAALLPRLEAAGEQREAANVICNRGAGLAVLQRWDEARAVLEQCRSARQAIGTPAGLAHATLLLGWTNLERGHIDDAAELLEQSLGYARAVGDSGRAWDARRWLAQAWIESDEIERAQQLLAGSEPDVAQDAGRHADWLASLGALALLREDTGEAQRLLATAVGEYAALGQQLGVERTRCRLALVDRDVPVRPDCDPLLRFEALRYRGEQAAALAALEKRLPSQDAELLREFLRELASGDPSTRSRRAGAVVARVYALGARSARAAGARERLLSRFGFELARASTDAGDASLARLAAIALVGIGDRAALPSVSLTTLSPASLEVADPPPELPPLPMLADDEAFVASTSLLGTAYLVVIRAGERVDVVRLAQPRTRRALAALRETVEAGRPAADVARDAAEALGLKSWLAPDIRRLHLLVHRELARVPWAALAIDGEPVARLNYRPLVDQAAVSLVIPGQGNDGPMPHRLAIVGAEGDGRSLPGVRVESDALREAALRAHWEVLDRNALDASGSLPLGILHLGGHAGADREDPNGGAFYIDDGNGGWTRLALPGALARRTWLVVLAGCETADGASSLVGNRSWGARVVERGAMRALAHLWPVEDTAAMRLHRAFYAAILDGADADVALALAQRERMRQRADASPYRWASGVIFARSRFAAASAAGG